MTVWVDVNAVVFAFYGLADEARVTRRAATSVWEWGGSLAKTVPGLGM